MNNFNPNHFIHAANILLLVAYSVRDILWLRVFAVSASVISLLYFLLQPSPLWAPLSWIVLFAAINSYQSWRLYLERRPVQLTPEEEEIRQLAFRDLPPRKVLQVLSLGVPVNAEPGEQLITSGSVPQSISLLIQGSVRVTKDERILGELGAGDFVGSALLLSGTAAEVDAVVMEPSMLFRWQIETLEAHLNANPDTRVAMQKHLAQDVARKVQRLS